MHFELFTSVLQFKSNFWIVKNNFLSPKLYLTHRRTSLSTRRKFEMFQSAYTILNRVYNTLPYVTARSLPREHLFFPLLALMSPSNGYQNRWYLSSTLSERCDIDCKIVKNEIHGEKCKCQGRSSFTIPEARKGLRFSFFLSFLFKKTRLTWKHTFLFTILVRVSQGYLSASPFFFFVILRTRKNRREAAVGTEFSVDGLRKELRDQRRRRWRRERERSGSGMSFYATLYEFYSREEGLPRRGYSFSYDVD